MRLLFSSSLALLLGHEATGGLFLLPFFFFYQFEIVDLTDLGEMSLDVGSRELWKIEIFVARPQFAALCSIFAVSDFTLQQRASNLNDLAIPYRG